MIAMAAVLTIPAPAMAQAATCGTATLQDVQVIAELVPTPTVTTARVRPENRGVHEWFGYTTPNRRLSKRYLVTVRLNDVVYTGESSGDGFWNFNPTTLVINDSFHACASKDRLRLTRPDGKEYSSKIVRVVRDQPSSPPRPPSRNGHAPDDQPVPESGAELSEASSPASVEETRFVVERRVDCFGDRCSVA